ncbi:MAG: DNA polymerase Y family protein [Aeromicrobium sp.]|uniref:DNA polymerase Y family protein n=1 Tax=Aeromicrobium sp. TaxID=1871063 RepID=UPI0039E6C74C
MRTLVLWCPDWPVVAAEQPSTVPVAVLAGGEVLACSPAARSEGVRRGMRRRDAQARCPELRLVDRAPQIEQRRFEEVLDAVEQLTPGVAPIRPGLCALRVPPRYYGGERETAAVLAERVVGLGVWDVRCGVADGVFAAEHAARRALTQDVCIVPPGGSADFVADLGVEVIEDVALADLLRRLGVRTLGAFARLEAGEVRTRFGDTGALLHRLARGEDPQPVTRRAMPPDLLGGVSFEPPLESAEAAVFSARRAAEDFVADLAHHGLVATGVRIEVDSGEKITAQARTWRHPSWFDAAALLDRLRWQLAGAGRQQDAAVWREGIAAIRFVPEETSAVGDHAETLFGAGPDAATERGVARVQALAGDPAAVRSLRAQGGRGPGDQVHTALWGERVPVARPAERPWPGQIPAPAPATVFAAPRAAVVAGAEGQRIVVTPRGAVSAAPARFRVSANEPWQQVAAWAGPWPVDERWWDEHTARRIARFQVVGVDGRAWLLMLDGDTWFTEARYD